jgi:hypothetical protein
MSALVRRHKHIDESLHRCYIHRGYVPCSVSGDEEIGVNKSPVHNNIETVVGIATLRPVGM